MRQINLILFVLLLAQSLCTAQTIYSTDFNDLALGFTENPANPDQDFWTAVFHPGKSFGEIQNAISNGGNAIHQFTDITNTNGQQSIDSRSFPIVPTAAAPELTFQIDFFATSSDLTTRNSFGASATLDGNGQVFSFSVGSGNGQVRAEVGVSVGLATFNGTNNNFPLFIDVGQNLTWNEWHSVEIVADLKNAQWISITVDGQFESLRGIDLPKNFDAKGPFTPTRLERVVLQVVNIENFDDETSDSIYFDNLLLAATLLGDANCDNTVDLLDVGPFINQLISGEFDPKADVNQDGVVDLLDVGPFVALLTDT